MQPVAGHLALDPGVAGPAVNVTSS
jgi:hypothetical protein